MKFLLTLVFMVSACGVEAATFDYRPDQHAVSLRLEQGDTVGLAQEAMDNMFDLAGRMLQRRGEAALANQLTAEWNDTYRLKVGNGLGDVGDHEALSLWVADWYAKLEAVLGVQTMELTHLRDIWVLNYTLPVIFRPQATQPWCLDQLTRHPDDTCEAEYRRHFAGTKYAGPDPYATSVLHHGFAGVVTYWVVWGACEAATYGGGWFVICSPAGDLAEIGVEKWVAPKASDRIWARENK